MAFNGNFQTVKENEVVRFKKIGYSFERDPGTPYLGWISDKHRCTWFNYLRGIDTVYPVEEKDYNPEYIILYMEGQIIGWIEKKYREKIIEAIFEYLMNWQCEVKPLEFSEFPRKTQDMLKPADRLQLSLF